MRGRQHNLWNAILCEFCGPVPEEDVAMVNSWKGQGQLDGVGVITPALDPSLERDPVYQIRAQDGVLNEIEHENRRLKSLQRQKALKVQNERMVKELKSDGGYVAYRVPFRFNMPFPPGAWLGRLIALVFGKGAMLCTRKFASG